MTVPLFRSLAAPLRRVRVTVPWVVGVHCTVVAWPAVSMKPGGTLNGLGLLPELVCAATAAARQAMNVRGAKRIVRMAEFVLLFK